MPRTTNHGVRRRSGLSPVQWIVLGLALLPAVGLAGWMMAGDDLRRRLAGETEAGGPPCRSLGKAEYEARVRRPAHKMTVYEDSFYRQFGHVQCGVVQRWLGSHLACQFTSPGLVRGVTPRGEWFFEPGDGKPATVTSRQGKATCVAASDFRLN